MTYIPPPPDPSTETKQTAEIAAVNAVAAAIGLLADGTETQTVTGPLTDTQLRATAVPVSGLLTDTQLRATAVPISGALTDTQLRATAVPVSGPLTDTQLRATPVPVSAADLATLVISNAAILAKLASWDVSQTLTRTADAALYAANDVIGAATGSTAALTFATVGPAAGPITITSVDMEIDVAAVISGATSYRLYLYNITPPSALGDNAPFDLPAGDRASFLGYIDLGTPVDLGSTLFVQSGFVGKDIVLASANLYGYLVTIGTYTPSSAMVHKITLHTSAR